MFHEDLLLCRLANASLDANGINDSIPRRTFEGCNMSQWLNSTESV